MSLSLPKRPHDRAGFTLVELLVVIAIIGLLIGLLMPAIQSARESARRTHCRNNLKQIGLAIHNYENARGAFPPSYGMSPAGDWSVQARILPHLEQSVVHEHINFRQSYKDIMIADGIPLSSTRIETYLCPSEDKDEPRQKNGSPQHYPLNYAVNVGTWLVFDPKGGHGGDGAFRPWRSREHAEFRDGLSATLCAAEVKAYTPYFRNAAHAQPALPGLPAAVCSLGGQFKTNSGHTEWVDGRSHQTGFTTVFPPNTVVECSQGGTLYDVDWTNQQEGKSDTVPTFAAVTARSHHPSMVNGLLMDGSVHSFDDDIDPAVWRALSTCQGHEPIPARF
jgi:prepilin-type N-terminal cleavage/methylation domain-containing protein